jgi:PPOX class probable F420-dependent enzyme
MPLTSEEIDRFLAEPHLCHFATVDDQGRPRVRPLWFLWKDGEFLFTTRLERRYTGRDLASSPSVAVSIASEDRPYRAVIAHGRPEIIERSEELLAALCSRYVDDPAATAHHMNEPDRVLMRMVPETILSWDYGREDTDSPKTSPIKA